MKIKEIKADGYKNLKGVDIVLGDNVNILCGKNAQGKTNLIEAVWICSGCRSFRSTRDKGYIGFDAERVNVEITYTDERRENTIAFSVMKDNLKDKKITLNGVRLPLLSKLFGNLKCVVFTPDDLMLSKGSPDVRRSFLDLSISQIKPSYLSALNHYNNILSQRNAMLKYSRTNGIDNNSLEVWNEQLAAAGAYISVLRYNYCAKSEIFSQKLSSLLTDNREKLTLCYHSTVYGADDNLTENSEVLKEKYLKKLEASKDNDINAGFTTCGVHRDDLITRINGLSVREYGSQGQARSTAIILKLSQAQILAEETKETPVVLLDDVMSELDSDRQTFILNSIENMQLIVTTCDIVSIERLSRGRVFDVQRGRIRKIRMWE